MTKERNFIGRDGELKWLDDLYKKSNSQMIVVYGRRRVGKSTLIHHFCESKDHLFITGVKDEKKDDLFARLSKYLADFFENPLVAKARIDSWQDIFEMIDLGKKNKKLIIVLDEFQWFVGRDFVMISKLQEHWDKKWKNENGIFLVLCGSIVSFMEKKVLSEKSPLYGRRTASLCLEPIPSNQAKNFFPKKGIREQIEFLMTFGGIPSYLELVEPKCSFAQNINRLALVKNAYFVNEVDFILREQLKNPKRYYLVLKKLALKPSSREELAQELKISNSGVLDLYLKTLTGLHLIRQFVPFGRDETVKTQKYMLWDEFLRFYFTFIFPNRELIKMNEDDWLYDRLVMPMWESYCGYSFELFCRKNIAGIIKALGIEKVFKCSGAYWQKKTERREGVQIDMIIERTDKTTHVVECKWSSGEIGKSIIEEIERKKELYPNPLKHTLKTTLITSVGITSQVKETHAIDDVLTLKAFLD